MRPGRTLLVVVALGLVPALLAPWWGGAGALVGLSWLALAVAAVVEARQSGPSQVRVSIELPRETVRLRPAELRLTLTNDGPVALAATLLLAPAPGVEGLPVQVPLTLAPQERLQLSWPLVLRRRGRRELGTLRIRAEGAWGLLERTGVPTALGAVSCWPAPGPAQALDAPRGGAGQRAAGRGSAERDPGRLVPFEPGMPARDIAWRVLARTGTLVAQARQRQVARRVVLAVDLGRRGRAAWGEGSWLDAAVEAALAQAAACQEQGDEVGLIAFSAVVEQQLRPRRGSLELCWAQLGPARAADSPGDPQCLVRTLQHWGGRGQLLVATPPPLDVVRWQKAAAALPEWEWRWLALDPPALSALLRTGDSWEQGAARALLAELRDQREAASPQIGLPAVSADPRPALARDPLLP